MADFFKDLKRDLDAATPGPWIVFTPEDYGGPKSFPGLGIENKKGSAVVWYAMRTEEGMQRDEDAALIARAPQLAQLVLLLPELREALTACERVHVVDLRAYDEAWEKTSAVLDAVDNLLAEVSK